MDTIHIKNLTVFANHGVFAEENALGQKFVVSCDMRLDTRAAGLTDDLEASVHYGLVAQEITRWMQMHTCKLLEAVAEGLARYILITWPLIREITLTIDKPWAPVHLPLDSVGVTITRARHRAFIALGSNLGDSRAILEEAVQKLDAIDGVCVKKCADWIVTAPYGGVEQPDFLNGAVEAETLLTAHELLHEMQRIELEAGRERKIHWGPRTLDLDLLFYDDSIIESDVLAVPHPEIEKRTFVLEPMVQIAPYFRHPVSRKTMRTLLDELTEGN